MTEVQEYIYDGIDESEMHSNSSKLYCGETSMSRLAFRLFLLLNATLFLRPAEIVPQLADSPIYEVIILLCLILTLPTIYQKIQLHSLAMNPITICVLGILPAIVMSLLAHGETWNVKDQGLEFFKVILYYLLLVSLVDSPKRLRHFLVAVAVFALLLNVIALLSYHHVIDLDTVAPLEEKSSFDPVTGERTVVVRLQAAGIYGNPNDLARIIVVGMTICLFAMAHKASWRKRILWLAPLGVFTYALQLTYSRGGLLALLSGMVILFHARYGMKKGAVTILLLLPLIILFDGRQTDIDTSSGTGQSRIKLWSEGLVAMRASPVFGIGTAHYFDMAGNHAHNSFIEAYVEMGIIGGTFFTSAFILAAAALYWLKSDEMMTLDPELWRMRPYILSLIIGTIVGQFSSSREYSLPTYMILGLATVYLSLAARQTPVSVIRFSPRLAARLVIVSAFTLVFFHLYTKFNAQF